MQTVAQGLETHLFDDLSDEGVLQQQSCFGFRDAALLHVEEGLLVEHAYGRAVGALHVVGIDFEHRLGVDAGRVGGAEVVVGFFRRSLLGVLAHQDPSGEGADGLVVGHALVEFAARAGGCNVVDERVVIDVLALVGHHASVHRDFRTLARQSDVGGVARQTVVEGDAVVRDDTIAAHRHLQVGEAAAGGVRLLQFVEVEAAAVGAEHFDDLRREERHGVHRMVAQQEGGFGTFLQHDEHTAVDHHIDRAAQDVDDLQGVVHTFAPRHVDKESVLGEGGVQQGLTPRPLLRKRGDDGSTFVIVFCYYVGMVDAGLTERRDVGNRLLQQWLVVDQIDKVGREVGDVAAEDFARIDGDADTVEVQAVVGRKGFCHVGVAVAFLLQRREALCRKLLHGRVAHGVHHGCAAAADQFALRGVEVDVL